MEEDINVFRKEIPVTTHHLIDKQQPAKMKDLKKLYNACFSSYEGQLKQMEKDAKDKTVKEGIRKVLNYIQQQVTNP